MAALRPGTSFTSQDAKGVRRWKGTRYQHDATFLIDNPKEGLSLSGEETGGTV